MTQLRGEQLRVRVRLVILDLAQKAAEAGKKYIYSASEVARLVPTTRKTLGRIDSDISETLRSLYAKRRGVNGDEAIDRIRKDNERLRYELDESRRQIDQLRKNHIDIYSALRGSSVNMGDLIRQIRGRTGVQFDNCPLCRQVVNDSLTSNVLPFNYKSRD